VFYWGQNSYGGAHLNNPELWEKDLAKYCDDGYMDVINLSFLNNFNAGTDLPEINFSSHCEDFFTDPAASKLRHCPKIGQDIKYCQSKGKKIILSLGGAIARTGFGSSAAASQFADTIWNMFMKGTHKFRPFDDAQVDGIDLDLEGGSQAYYDVFLSKLQTYYKSDPSKKYYVSAAPQCVFPDGNLQTIMETSYIDFINIQFYNNWCGVQNYGNQWAWNWGDWDKWVHTKSFNKNIKLILGVPASPTAAGTGYISTDSLQKIITDLKSNNTFAGVMMWDASQS
ncbi:glycoside hydrolase, partial [Neoconidiobolus thromboides FSU 785]